MDAKAIEALSSLLLTKENLGVMVAAWTILSVAKKVLPGLFKKSVMARILPLLPMVLCMGMVWLPGIRPKGVDWGWLLVLGVVLGWGVGSLHKVLKQTVLGQDALIQAKKPEKTVTVDEEGEVTVDGD